MGTMTASTSGQTLRTAPQASVSSSEQISPTHTLLLSSEGNVVSPTRLLPLKEENVERVLEEVRPGLMADGGNVALHEIDGLLVVLKLQGVCGSCPSSTMTLKMGIETHLRDKIPAIIAVEQILDAEPGLELNEENIEEVRFNRCSHSQ